MTYTIMFKDLKPNGSETTGEGVFAKWRERGNYTYLYTENKSEPVVIIPTNNIIFIKPNESKEDSK